MADQEHLNKLKEGVEAWNQWREEQPDIRPNLSSADLTNAHLSGADFIEATLSYAHLSNVNL